MERLVDLKRILVSQGTETNFNGTWGWPEYDVSNGGAYLYGRCDWSAVTSVTDLTLPNCTMGELCSGHNEEDTLEFGNFLSNNDNYTNGEFFKFIHPWTSTLPYTYDTFDYDYCVDQGNPKLNPSMP
jgi:hypothetical protein